jgi:diaminopimelate epimerase
MTFRTLAGIIGAKVGPEDVSIRMTDPSGLRTGIALGLGDADLPVHFINTGVPHTIVFTDDVKDVSVSEMGRAIRFHESFAPEGTNVNFVQVLGEDHIHVRTYERGVEAETYACGTGAVASAVMAHHLGMTPRKPVNVRTRGGKLMIDFAAKGSSYSDVWLMGPADTVFTGEVRVGQ